MNEWDRGLAIGRVALKVKLQNDLSVQDHVEQGKVSPDKVLTIVQAYAISVAEEKKEIISLGQQLPLTAIGPIINAHFSEYSSEEAARLKGDRVGSDVVDEIAKRAAKNPEINSHIRDRRLRNECVGVLAKLSEHFSPIVRRDVLDALKKAAKQQKAEKKAEEEKNERSVVDEIGKAFL